MFFSNFQARGTSAEARTANHNVVTLPASLPTNYLQIMHFLRDFNEIEVRKIKASIKKAKEKIRATVPKIRMRQNTNESLIAAYLAACLAHFQLGQEYSKMAQAELMFGHFQHGSRYISLAEQIYEKTNDYNWEKLINKVFNPRWPIAVPHSEDEAKNDVFLFYKEFALIYFLKYKHRPENSNKLDFKESLNEFLIRSDVALTLQPDDNDLLFIKTIFLLDFLSISELVESIKEKYLQAAEKFLQHSPDDNKKTIIAFCYQITKKILSNEQVNITYESAIPSGALPKIKWFFANIYFEYVYGQFTNTDLTVFIPGSAPENSGETALLAFENLGMNISIANIYKFMAHFRNITARFQVAANPKLNADILDALYTNGFLDVRGNIRSDLTEVEEVFFAELMQSIYQIYFPNIPVALEDLSPTALSQHMNDRSENLEDVYDGLSPEMALFLLSKSLNILTLPECQRAGDCFILLKNALWYRSAPILHQAPVFIESLVAQFQNELKDGAVKMLLITCPVLKEAELEFRHSIYVLFRQTGTQIKIQIINAGFGSAQFHQNGSEVLSVRELVLENDQTLFSLYLTSLFNLSSKTVGTSDEFMQELSAVYRLNGTEFAWSETIFPSQVTGNCTIFGAQWALRIALGLTEEEHDKLALDFAKGADILASNIRSQNVVAEPEFVIQAGLPEDRLKFPCGYESKRRKDFKAPASHSTPEYAPGIPGTNHHIVPQSYLQFLYDKLSGSDHDADIKPDCDLLCDVLGKPHGTHVTKKQFAYGNFDLFHGPSDRSDDPKDDTTDPLNNEQGIEQKQPIGFPKARWDALQEIGSTLRTALNTTSLSAADKTTAINSCKAQLAIIVSDASRTQCFKEAAAGNVWEIDPSDVTKYKLKTPPPAPVSTTTSTSSSIFGSALTTSSGATVPLASGPGGP